MSATVHAQARSYRGFNFFDPEDELLFEVIARGEFNISGFRNKTLRRRLPGLSSGQVSRLLKRLRTHGLIKKTAHGYKYYLTALGRQVTALGATFEEPRHRSRTRPAARGLKIPPVLARNELCRYLRSRH